MTGLKSSLILAGVALCVVISVVTADDYGYTGYGGYGGAAYQGYGGGYGTGYGTGYGGGYGAGYGTGYGGGYYGGYGGYGYPSKGYGMYSGYGSKGKGKGVQSYATYVNYPVGVPPIPALQLEPGPPGLFGFGSSPTAQIATFSIVATLLVGLIGFINSNRG